MGRHLRGAAPFPAGPPGICPTAHHGLPSCAHPARQTRWEACLLVPQADSPTDTWRGHPGSEGLLPPSPGPGLSASWPLPDTHPGTLVSIRGSGCPQLLPEWGSSFSSGILCPDTAWHTVGPRNTCGARRPGRGRREGTGGAEEVTRSSQTLSGSGRNIREAHAHTPQPAAAGSPRGPAQAARGYVAITRPVLHWTPAS